MDEFTKVSNGEEILNKFHPWQRF